MKAIIFDMDGVIIDSEPMHKKIEVELLEELGGTVTEEEHMTYTGTTDEHMWSSFKKKFQLEPAVEDMITSKKERFMDQIHTIPLVEGFEDVVKLFHDEGYLLALASSNNRSSVDQIIKQFDLEQYLEVSMSGEDIVNGKPAPDIFLKTAEKLKVEPEDCLVIEDAKNGVTAAKAAGMKCIGLDNPNSGVQDLSEADLVLTSYEELDLEKIKELFKQ